MLSGTDADLSGALHTTDAHTTDGLFACVQRGKGPWNAPYCKASTVAAPPGAPQNVNVHSVDCTNAIVCWSAPLRLSGAQVRSCLGPLLAHLHWLFLRPSACAAAVPVVSQRRTVHCHTASQPVLRADTLGGPMTCAIMRSRVRLTLRTRRPAALQLGFAGAFKAAALSCLRCAYAASAGSRALATVQILLYEAELCPRSAYAKAHCGIQATADVWLGVYQDSSPGCVINDLQPGCHYTVCTRAISDVGPGAWACPIDVRTSASTPLCPEKPTVAEVRPPLCLSCVRTHSFSRSRPVSH